MARSSSATAGALPSRSAQVKRLRSGALHPGTINVLPQVRPKSELTNIPELADNIADVGLLQDAGIAELTYDAAVRYLAFFTKAFKARLGVDVRLSIDDLVVDIRTGYYYIAILGHRRIAANLLLFAQGCSDCRSRTKSDAAGAKRCMRMHLSPNDLGDGMTVKLYHNIDPQRALDMQMSENTYVPVSREAETEILRMDWETARALDPTLTKKAFARSKGRSVAFISDALRYCDLPQLVRDSVTRGTTSYTTALELCRLQSASCDDDTVIFTMQKICAEGMTSKQAARFISGILAARSEAPVEEFSLFEEPVDTGRRGVLVNTAEQQQYRVFGAEVSALSRTLRAIETGMLPRQVAVTSDRVRHAIERGTQVRRELAGATA